MHFTVIRIIIMFLIGYVCLYALIDRVMKCIEEKTRKIRTGRKHKAVKRVPDSKMSTYNYMPAVKHNLPYQRRNF